MFRILSALAFFSILSTSPAYAGQIMAQHSNRCIDILGVAGHDGAELGQWDCAQALNQDFTLSDVGEGYLTIQAKHSGKCLEVPGFNLEGGTTITQYSCVGSDNQKWKLVPNGAGFLIQNKHSDLCLDVWAWERGNGARLAQSGCHGGANQTFMVVRDEELKALARQYAPEVRLHRDERFFPSSVEQYAAGTHVVCRGQVVADSLLDARNLPGNADECFVESRERLSGPYDLKPFLFGEDVRHQTPPLYASVYLSRFGVINIQYAMFYPYNEGKSVCFSLAPAGYCLTNRHMMGNHLGDWESFTLQIENGVPTQVRLGAHGKRRTLSAGQLQWRGSHPIVYAAKGSHGLYEGEGSHVYQKIPTGDKLIDVTEDGSEWRSWQNLQIISGREGWMNYRGRFGNSRLGKNACQLTPLSVLNSLGKVWNPFGGLFGARLESTEEICQRLGLNENYQLDYGPWWQSFDQDRHDF